jgi:SulP family sulfate permease
LDAVFAQGGGLATVAVVAALGLLLNLHSLETTLGRDIDFDRELRVAGLGNIAAGAVGGGPGFTYLSDTVLLHRVKAMRRGTALVASLVAGSALLLGPSLLTLVPTAVAAGLLLFVGTSFIIEWLWDTRTTLPAVDRVALAGIVLVVAVFGLVEGIVGGLVLAVVLFVVRYSRIDVVQHRYDLTCIRSRVDRTPAQSAWLAQNGTRALVIELRGFLFFGTAHGMVDTVADHAAAEGTLEWVVLDFSRVTGLDATAAGALSRLQRGGTAGGYRLVVACEESTRRLLGGGDPLSRTDAIRFESDLDAAIAWCEDRLLDAEDAPADQTAVSLVDSLSERVPRDVAEALEAHFSHEVLRDGDRIIDQGAPARGLFFIESGTLTAVLDQDRGARRRLSAMRAEALLGEVSLYGDSAATASVVAEGPARVAHLSPQAFDRLRSEDPVAAAHLHELVAHTLVQRLGRAEAAMRQLRE